MRTIFKLREPASLTEFRPGGGSSFDDFPDKDALRRSLVKEQRGLCCYCLSRIRPVRGEMKIEHWLSQSGHAAEQLVYSNLMGACMGREGQPSRDRHCDTRKGNRDLSRNPANPLHRVEEFLRYGPDGTIRSDDPDFETEINDVLNLNLPFSIRNRKATLDGFVGALAKRGELPRRQLERWLAEWNGEAVDDELNEYCQVIVYWLKKRLARA